jgi:hypothetical protein
LMKCYEQSLGFYVLQTAWRALRPFSCHSRWHLTVITELYLYIMLTRLVVWRSANQGSIIGRVRYSSHFHCVQTNSGSHKIFCAMSTLGDFLGGKAAVKWSWPLISRECRD